MERLKESSRYRWPWVALVLGVATLVWTGATRELRWEHWASIALLVGTAWLGGAKGRRFGLLCLPLVLSGLAYDNYPLFKPWLQSKTIHVADLYHAELSWFGIETAAGKIVPAQWFLDYTHPALDLICGLAYIIYLFVPIGLTMLFVFTNEDRCRRVGWGWFVVNLMGIATYLAYPAAPPWYVFDYGLGPAVLDALPSAAGAARFDVLTGSNYFASFYERNATVFGAMPSLHVGYPTMVAFALLGMGKRWTVPAFLFAGLVAFSAVYLQHHYVWDLVIGALYGFLAVVIVALAEQRFALPGSWQDFVAAMTLRRQPA